MMMRITRIFQILILVFYLHMAPSSHFQGGTITYKIVNISGSIVSIMITQTYLYRWPVVYCDNARILSQSSPNASSFPGFHYNLSCVSNCTTTGGYQPVPVQTYCTDYSSAMAISVTQRTDVVNLTSGAYFTVAFVSSAWRQLTLPTPGSSGYNWSVSCVIDLRIRADTGKLNTPPVVTMISPIYIPFGTQTALIIPTIDADNDDVRCRFANSAAECASVCPPASLPNNTVILSNCTLLITGANVGDWYAAALQVEDFVDSSSTTPLSSVPVQFLIYVYALPNCTTTPLLYGASKQTGTCQSLQVGQTYTMTLYAENYCSAYGVTINDIATLSFPIVFKTNVTQNTSTLYSVSLTWTPTADQVGSQILCAVAVDSQNVQSNQYCVVFAVSENSTAACPVRVVETTLSLATTTYLTDEESTADDTTVITTTTIISKTTSQSSTEWPWLLPLIAVLSLLLLLICCLCLCCPPPYSCGFLCRKTDENESPQTSPDPDGIRQSPRMYMIQRALGKNFDNDNELASSFGSSRSITPVGNYSDRFPITFRNGTNRTGKNLVWVYPSPRPNKSSTADSHLSSSRSTILSNTNSASFPITVRNRTNKSEKVWIEPSSELEDVSGRSSRAGSVTESDINLNLSSTTLRPSAEKQRKNVVWVHPSS